MKRGAQQSLPLNDEAALQNIRRANLHVLTSRKGSKVRLATVIGISASNLDNRLYGQKRMDDTETARFIQALGLPPGWLDIPRVVTDIPESVSALLNPQSRQPASNPQTLPAAAKPETAVAGKSTDKPAKTRRDGHVQSSKAKQNNIVAKTKEAVAQPDPAPPPSDLAIRQPADSEIPTPASQQLPVSASFTEVVTEPRRSAPLTSLDDLIGIAPIAEALIKTLAGKARSGRLDEMKALDLLQKIVLL
jgi:hypothetical protein